MTNGPIEHGWLKIEQATPFCCDAHRLEAKGVYFTGAMAALIILTDWNPDVSDKPPCVDAAALAVVAKELTAVFLSDKEAEVFAQAGQVHH